MEEALEKDLVKRSDICKLFGMRDMSWLDVRQVNQLPAVDVMELPTVQRMQKELVETKARLVSAQLANEGLKAYCLKIMVEKANPALKTKPLVRKKKWAKSHADGKQMKICIVDEFHDVGTQHTPTRRIRQELNPGDVVTVESGMYREKYGKKRFLVIDITGGVAELTDADTRSRHLLEEVKNLKLVSRHAQPGGKEQ